MTPKRKRRRRRNDETVPDNVEIPGIATAETDVTNETHESYQERRSFHDDHHQDDDDDAFSDASSEDEIIRAIDPSEAEDEDVLSPTASSMHTDESLIATPTVRNLVRTPSFDSVDLTPKTTPSLSAAQTLPVLPTGANEEGDDDYHAGDFSEILRPKLRSPNTRFVPAQRLTPPSTDELSLSLPSLNVKRERHTNFPIPEDQVVVEGDEGIEGEESKEEIEPVGGSAVAGAGGVSVEVLSQDDHVGPPLHIPIPLVARDSLMTVTSDYTYDDESTCSSSIVCPICLSGYRMGDFIVTSKYCTHMFHKQCILEWLTKHDDCPICRVKMVTASEISKAAIHMVRAGAPIPASATTAATTTSMIEMTTPTLPSVQTPPMSPLSRRVNSPFGGLGLAVLLATSAEGDQQYPSR